ncbi:serine hydrolase [Rugosimonospora acidiphila]|uniref:Serine hydrolase n=2 Tax=Rugosimonospora acidiphila TaxID=556531 RepID=A0ABP9RHV3_9ACTN
MINRSGVSPVAAVRLPSATPSAPGPASPRPSVDPAVYVRARIAAYLAQYGSHASFALLDKVTGEEVLYQEGTEFETGSIVKVDILATLLWQGQQSGTSLSQSQRQLATQMITESDNDAATALWDQIGGASALAEANAVFGLTETTPGQDGYWGLTTTTAADQLRLLQLIANSSGPLNSSSRAYLLGLMSRVDGDQRWGVPVAADAQATGVYVKNGWLSRSTEDDKWIINSIGRIVEPAHDWLIVVLSNYNATQNSGITLVQHAADLAVQDRPVT